MDIYSSYIENNVPFLLYNDLETKYKCYGNVYSKKFNHLHKIVICTKEHTILEEYLEKYLETEIGKIELNSQNKKGYTAIMLAFLNLNTNSTLKTIQILIKANANLDLQTRKNGWTILMYVCFYSNIHEADKVLKMLIKANINLDFQDYVGATALIYACHRSNITNSLKIIKRLIDAKANLDIQDNAGCTALIYACKFLDIMSTFETVKILIDAGAKLDIENNEGYTALMYLLNNNNVNNICDYLEYYKNMDKDKLENYIKNNKIPINIYDYLIDNNVINPIKSGKYAESKYNIKIFLKIFMKYTIKKSECLICTEYTRTILCNYNHATCFKCLHSLNYKCHGCQLEL